MTRDTYIRMTQATARAVSRLPGGAQLLRLPTLLCAAVYALSLIMLLIRQDMRILRVIAVPAACFFAVTALRPVIGRQRPYDRFGAAPVGQYKSGKGKSMPSRHAASAAAIAFAVIYAFPGAASACAMIALALLIAALRVVSGQHYPGDVLAALALSAVFSLIGYILL